MTSKNVIGILLNGARVKRTFGFSEMSAVLRRTLLMVLVISLMPFATATAATGTDWPMEPMSPDLQDLPSLQNGWRLYVNYCLACHSLQYQRYERTADDLGVPHEIALEQLVFTGQKIGEQMTSAMRTEMAKQWFGAPPPDLTMVARTRGVEWLYNYLKTFYLDDSRPFGVNNKVFENVGMPNVLLELQESLPPEEFDQAVYDIVNFLYYTGEPSRLERHRLGVFVLLFLIILFVFTYLLGREYQKDVKH